MTSLPIRNLSRGVVVAYHVEIPWGDGHAESHAWWRGWVGQKAIMPWMDVLWCEPQCKHEEGWFFQNDMYEAKCGRHCSPKIQRIHWDGGSFRRGAKELGWISWCVCVLGSARVARIYVGEGWGVLLSRGASSGDRWVRGVRAKLGPDWPGRPRSHCHCCLNAPSPMLPFGVLFV